MAAIAVGTSTDILRSIRASKLVYPADGASYGWVRSLCGAPDVPHAGHESQVSFVTEGNGVGVLKAPPVSAEGLAAQGSRFFPSSTLHPLLTASQCLPVSDSLPPASLNGSSPALVSGLTATLHRLSIPDTGVGCHGNSAVSVCFKVSPAPGVAVQWETLLVDGQRLYVEVPPGILPEGSRESLVELLEYAEDQLKCSHVILCFKKNRPDRSSLLRVFNFFGFSVLPPGHRLAPPQTESLLFMACTFSSSSDNSDDDDNDDGEGSE